MDYEKLIRVMTECIQTEEFRADVKSLPPGLAVEKIIGHFAYHINLEIIKEKLTPPPES